MTGLVGRDLGKIAADPEPSGRPASLFPGGVDWLLRSML